MGILFLIGGGLCCLNAYEGLAVLANSATAVDKIMRRGLVLLDSALAEKGAWEAPGLGPSTAVEIPSPPELPDGFNLCRFWIVYGES